MRLPDSKPFRQEGYILAIVLCILVVVGSVGVTVLTISAARYSSVEVLEARLEAARLVRACSDLMAATAMHAAATDTSVAYPSTEILGERIWEIRDGTVNPESSFPGQLISEARGAAIGDNRDVGAPDSLSWLAPASEAVKAQATLHVERPNRLEGQDPVRLDLPVEATLWRIPAGATNLLVSQQEPQFGFPVATEGLVVIIPGENRQNPPANLYPNAPDKLLFSNSGKLEITAGSDVAARIHAVYGLYPALNPAFDRDLTSLDESYAGIESVMIGGEKHFGLDLSSYSGPTAIAVRGAAIANGFVLIGAPLDSTRDPISIAVDGPMILAGSNGRYVSSATTARKISFYSGISKISGEWVIDDKSPAANTEWHGHIFIAAVDPEFQLDQDWSAASFLLVGSLHLLGGKITQVGTGANSLGLLSIHTPKFTKMPVSPFSAACRQEGFVAWSRL